MLLDRLRHVAARLFGPHADLAPSLPRVESSDDWKESLERFFSHRAGTIPAVPTLDDLCYISGRDPRLWTQQGLLDDLVASILEQSGANDRSHLLEVGCASGFIARAIAPRVAQYTGVDLAGFALEVARRLRLPNATFGLSDGGELSFVDSTFDAAICYDVVTNFPRFEDGVVDIIVEMLRVVRPGCRVLVGSVPDARKQNAFEVRTREVTEELEHRLGPLKLRPESTSTAERTASGVAPGIVCYYFDPSDFIELGRKLGVAAKIADIHGMNPYYGYRFNVIYTKRGA